MHGHLGGRPPAVDLGNEKKLAELLHAASQQSLISSAHDLSAGGLAQALAEGVLRFGVGARVWLSEIMERDGVDAASALFSESTGRVIVTVPREDDVKFRGLCEGRGYPVLRIGVSDAPGDGDEPALEVQGLFTVPLTELRDLSTSTLPAAFGADGRPSQPPSKLTAWRTTTSTATTTRPGSGGSRSSRGSSSCR